MARSTGTRDVEKQFGRRRLSAAHAYLDQAKRSASSADDEYARAAAISSAILAAIAAADAACALALGQVWKGDHALAHTLLRKVRGGGDAAKALQRIVGQKTKVQYLTTSVTAGQLATAIRQAEVVVAFAIDLRSER
mgnify:CR=1 FL=1